MSDQRAIAVELVRAARSGERVVLASVVRAEGSSYRGVGARMVIRANDTTVGLLSGGCLEGDLVTRASRVRESGRSAIATYDGRADDDLVWGLGLGCNGLVEVLLESCSPRRAGALGAMVLRALDEETPSVIATVVRAEGNGTPGVGVRALVRAGAAVVTEGEWGSGELLREAIADAAHAEPGARRGMNLDYVPAEGASARIAFELVLPTVQLVICGSGPDAIPVARLASALGWAVTVVDPRPATFTPPARFGAARVAECAHSGRLGDAVALSSRTAAIVMSHNYERDLDYLDALAVANVAYVGLLGPRARTERMLGDLAARGRPLPEAMLERVFGPIGLDLGGDGPEAIALSIVAELLAVMNGRAAAHLRERRSSIHDAEVTARR